LNIHATAIALGAVGVLIEGPSGAGKTSLALAAIEKMQSQNQFASLVADDQCLVEITNGRLIATCPPALAGLVEMRGLGILTTQNMNSIVVDCVIRLVSQDRIERVFDRQFTMVDGVQLPLFELPARQIAISVPILMQIVKDHRF
jgi:serine kinase of HPr protein (carbohydrate metabolism regulator)